jgi:hypothetical protein
MDVSGQLHALAALAPREEPPVPTEQEAVMAPALVWMLSKRGKYLASAGN